MNRLLLALAVVACAHAPARRPQEDEAQIRARLAQWTAQFNSGDFLAAATIWAPDLIGVIPGGPDDSFEREQAGARKATPGPTKFALTVDEVLVDGDLALVRDTWRQSGAGKPVRFRSFEVWRRQADGQWKIARWIDAAPEPD